MISGKNSRFDDVVGVVKFVILPYIYVQIFEAHNFSGLLFPNISQKQFFAVQRFHEF